MSKRPSRAVVEGFGIELHMYQKSGTSPELGIYPFVESATMLRRGKVSSVQQPSQPSVMPSTAVCLAIVMSSVRRGIVWQEGESLNVLYQKLWQR